MRPIKFRAWIPNDIAIWLISERKKVNGKETSAHMRYDISAIHFWEDGLPIQTSFRPEKETRSGMRRETEDPMILMQFTGLLDKNGKEIYEGDIVKTEFGNFEVYYRTELAGWYIKDTFGRIEFLAGWIGNVHTNEVIGNIYENHGLLESAGK